MDKYAKLIDGILEYPPKNKGNILNYSSNEKLLKKDGYKTYIQNPYPSDGKIYTSYYVETEDYITQEWLEIENNFTNEDIRRLREAAYQYRSDSMYIAYQKYLALGKEEKAEEMRIAWLNEVAKIDLEYPYKKD